MKILAVDYGMNNVGLAVSDEIGIVATPLCVLKNDSSLLAKIEEIVKSRKVAKIVVGLPEWESYSYVVDEIKIFVSKLRERVVNIEIEFVNEYYSTKSAQKKLAEIGKRSKSVRNKLDAYSACEILQTYLERKRYENS